MEIVLTKPADVCETFRVLQRAFYEENQRDAVNSVDEKGKENVGKGESSCCAVSVGFGDTVRDLTQELSK